MNTKHYLGITLLASVLWFGCKKDRKIDSPVVPESNQFVTSLVEYVPAPGQFINLSLGNMNAAKSILGKEGLVSLGAWGGYIVLGFDHTVPNRKDLADIMVKGNAQSNFAEPGIIWVMKDDNKNGKADDTWYEIAGSEFGKTGYLRNYEVTYTRPVPGTGDVSWKDNQGNTGVIGNNTVHSQSYYPDWLSSTEYTLKGSLLPSTNINMTNPGLITSMPFASGYADNLVAGDAIDISNAVDKDGKSVVLSGIDFIKIQTGIQANLKAVGEFSTEISSVADLSLVK
ncbi:cell surface protein [Pedobacter sp. KBW06]|uniref:cell surface protein n=1 Tax=Pedobacter sp. KBW06 TaxID=2153359 RepID=UPI000F5A494E|nr:cell surface protein [Pedobacter sp. KBW06]RQO69674.1 cell surface protein [Pedobacter sp. KBW06]